MLEPIHECSVQRRLAARRLIVPGLAIIGAALAPGRADACGGSASPNYTISGVSPSSGSSAVPRDAGIIVSGVPSFPAGGSSTFADVALIDAETEQAVSLLDISWDPLGGSEDTLALHPSQPLESQHSYRVEATPIDLVGDGSQGPVFVTSFTTSSALLEPLVLSSGKLGISLRGGDVDIIGCGLCGYGCAVTGKRRALLADVQLPAPSGGQGVYRGALHFLARTPKRVSPGDPASYVSSVEPHDIRATQLVKIEAGEALTLTQEVPEEGSTYEGCFMFVVWDPAGHVTQTSACLPSLSDDDIQALARDDAPLALSTDADIASETVRQAIAVSDNEAQGVSCAFGAGQPTTISAWLTLLLSSFMVRSLSRRR